MISIGMVHVPAVWVVIFLIAILAPCAHAARVCILDDDIPGLDRERLQVVAGALRAGGHEVSARNCRELADGGLSVQQFDCLALTDSPIFPAELRDALLKFIAAGGDLVLMGGYAFETSLVQYGEKWVEIGEVPRLLLESADDAQMLFDFDGEDLSLWTRGADDLAHPTEVSLDAGRRGDALRLDIRLAQWYDVLWRRLEGPVTPDHNAVCLWAKGDKSTPQLFIEVTETDGTRWSRAVDIGTEWGAAILPESTFLFKQDGSPKDRGGPEDGLDLTRAARITVGLARDRVPSSRGDHTLWIDEIATMKLDPDELPDAQPVGLPVFSRYEPYGLRDVVRSVPAPGQNLVAADVSIDCPAQGTWSLGFPLPKWQSFIPLLSGLDEHGRDRGWTGGLLVNQAGQYAGSNWAIFGATTPGFYTSQVFGEMLARIVSAMESPGLGERMAAESRERDGRAIALTSPAPEFVRISEDGRHFVNGQGERIFLTGCNYIGSFGRRFFGGPWLYYLEDDFRKAHEAGINAMRVYGAGAFITDAAKRDALCELARRYGIYLLITAVDHTDLLTKRELQDRVRLVATVFKDEPMVIGYDLQNEPYTYKVADIADDDGQTLGERYPKWAQWPDYMKWAGLEIKSGNDHSSFPNVDGPLPVNDEWRGVFEDTNAIWESWVNWQVEAIREVDQRHFITAGYNTIQECLPANERLDYVAHHTYRVPYTHEDVVLNLTVLDRIRGIWPDRPICLGEFGYSNGDVLADGYTDLHTSAVGEIMHYLYAYANDFEGVHKWELNDNPLWISLEQTVWVPKSAIDVHTHQGRFGMHYYDGTISGRPKPICHALRFLRDSIDAGMQRGEMKLEPGPTRINTVYEYRAPGALFVGSVRYESPEMSFTSEHAANVMLRWDADGLNVMSSADADVEIDLRKLNVGGRKITGLHGGANEREGRLAIRLLEGELVTVGN